MMLGLRDYVDKNRFPGVVLGLSGGIDSASDGAGGGGCARARAGARRDDAVALHRARQPGRRGRCARGGWASGSTRSRSRPRWTAFGGCWRRCSRAGRADITEENMQSRIRGVLLMAMSNKFGAMLLTTGNKSEMSVGYATLYGDMCGGYSVLKDVYKTDGVRAVPLAQPHRSQGCLGPAGEVIPARVIDQAADRRAARRTRRIRIRCRPTRSSTRSWTGWSSRTCRLASWWRAGFERETVRRVCEPARPRRVQAPAGAAGGEDHARRRSGATGATRSPTRFAGSGSGISRQAIDVGGMEVALCGTRASAISAAVIWIAGRWRQVTPARWALNQGREP